jgi:putative N-acetylmannosamine-6-phosphate epimerase
MLKCKEIQKYEEKLIRQGKVEHPRQQEQHMGRRSGVYGRVRGGAITGLGVMQDRTTR